MIVLHRRGTTNEWQQADLTAKQLPDVLLKDGEFAIEERADGSRFVKIGDGHTKFCDLPYIDARAEMLFDKRLANAENVINDKLTKLATSQNIIIDNSISSVSKELTQKIATATETLSTEVNTSVNALDTRLSKTIKDSELLVNTRFADMSSNVAELSAAIDCTIMPTISNLDNKVNNNFVQQSKDIEALTTTISSKTDDVRSYAKDYTDEAISNINDKVANLYKAINSATETTKAELTEAIDDVSAEHTDSLYAVKNSIEALIHAGEKDNLDRLAKLRADLENVELRVSDELSMHISQYEVYVSEIYEKINLVNKTVAQLDDSDITLVNLVHSINNTLTATTDKLADDLLTLSVRQTEDFACVSDAIATVETSSTAADQEISAALLEHTTKIYAELVDLVNEDAVIMNKVFSVENNLAAEIHAIDALLAATTAQVNDINNKIPKIIKEQVTPELTSLGISLTDKITEATTQLEAGLNTEIESRIANLATQDFVVGSQFVTKVSQTNGKIDVERIRPTAADIAFNDSDLYTELSSRASDFSTLHSRAVQFNEADSRLYVGHNTADSIIFCCGTAADVL